MDDLGKMISAAISGELLDGFLVDNVVFSHLLFSDDILIFYGAFPTHLRLLWSLFHCFEAASGWTVNLGKSELLPVGNVDQMERLAGLLGCGVSTLSVKYLNLSLGASNKAKHNWNGVIEKMECRLASW